MVMIITLLSFRDCLRGGKSRPWFPTRELVRVSPSTLVEC
jgi:hypothetical protein